MDGQKYSQSEIIRLTNEQALRKYKTKKRSNKSLNKQAKEIASVIVEHQKKYGEYII